MKVSVIIPVFNGESCLEKAINSVLKQNFKKEDYEIIVINDCSNDNTENIILDFNNKTENFIYIKNEKNLGVNESRNKAINIAKGKYIAFLDADDEWMPEKLSIQYKKMNENKDIVLSFTDFSIYNDKEEYICDNFDYWNFFKKEAEESTTITNPTNTIIKENVIGTSCVMVKKSTLLETNLFRSELGYSQDWDLWLNLSTKGSFLSINKPLMKYFMLPNSITRKKRTKKNLINIVEKYKEYCDLKTYEIAKSNCYAFTGESAFLAGNKKEGCLFFLKSFNSHFQINHLKKMIWYIKGQ
jgi:glycosyltransferase involved in cell wall biosynthesis